MKPLPRVSSKKYAKIEGLGDLVHAVAQPIARVIDSMAGTNIKGCSSCAKRREEWNRAIPFNGLKP